MFLIKRILMLLLLLWSGSLAVYAQDLEAPADTLLAQPADSLALANDSVPEKKAGLDAPVTYQATDSMVMTAGNWAYLYGEGDVKYQNIELQSELIEMNLDSSMVYAKFGLDSIGDEFGYPLFKEGEQQYESKTMRYNFKSKKGYITDVITQQGEGYVTAGRTKKMEGDVLNMVGGRYTTCDEHEHPHFYIQMTKAKVRPKKNIVTGPVYLVLEDVPLYPLGLPFCFFPFSSTYSSGIIMPTFGDESTRGFYLREGGYYFALSDYMDLAVLGEIYTKGSWGLSAKSQYKKRYKYSGNFNASYLVTKLGDKGLPDYSLSKDFKIQWTHTQDPKANPNLTFSASVNFATSSYDRNNTNSLYNGDINNNTTSSSVNITKRFPNSPFTISGTMNVNQVKRDSSISLTLPSLTVTMTKIFPFKRKKPIGKERWYEKIAMSYTGTFSNSITTKENQLLKSNLVKDWKNGAQHKIPVSATFQLFNYINITPQFDYTERWYTSKITQEYDPQQQRMVARDTTYNFYRVYDFSGSISASTTLYGFFKPLPFLGNKVEMIRHRFEPSVSFSAAPDFASSRFGFYEHYVYQDANGNDQEYIYSPFSHNMYGVPGQGKQGNVSFQLNNNLEMKVRSDKDSTGFKKISLIDKLSLGMSYNLAADSFQWSDLSASIRLKLSKSYTLNLSGMFDTYTYDENGQRLDIPRWKAGKGIGRLRSTSTSFSYTFNNDTFKKLFGKKDEGTSGTGASATGQEGTDPGVGPTDGEATGEEAAGSRLLGKKKDTGEYDSDGYLVGNIPWSLSFSYSLSLGYGTFNREKREYDYRLTNSLSFNGNIQPTKNWTFNFNATYDFDAKKISYMTCNISRNMHCWQMTASFVPVGPYKSYSFSVSVSSSLLKDLKYDKRSNYRDGQDWY
ncbi:MAG TPA: LPS-assembly protein LptD [Candidatus Parabacteroides intestinipullorum]|uniref:LPS-assembly protein LptD n=1 Tax=Candidatus Parabacteroides intestinipullorum TaxID=2838723 RepID=A0A9D1X7C0_9BACT|nr:LPS-assembly protein LptD [Candidatus Parabacteroides intestinipullorum]